MGKQRHQDVKELACGHPAGTQKTKEPSGIMVTPEPPSTSLKRPHAPHKSANWLKDKYECSFCSQHPGTCM